MPHESFPDRTEPASEAASQTQLLTAEQKLDLMRQNTSLEACALVLSDRFITWEPTDTYVGMRAKDPQAILQELELQVYPVLEEEEGKAEEADDGIETPQNHED